MSRRPRGRGGATRGALAAVPAAGGMRRYSSGTPAPVPFELDGVVFHATAMPTLEIFELARFADVEVTAGAMAELGDFFRNIMGQDYDRFRAHVKVHGTPLNTLLEIVKDLMSDMGKAPSAQPSPLPAGQSRTDRALRVVSSGGESVPVQAFTREEAAAIAARRADERAQIEAMAAAGTG